MDLDLAGRAYVVTGATSGLGRATVDALVAEGAQVVASARSAANLASLEERFGGAVSGVVADNGDPGTAPRLVDAVRKKHGRLDGVLVSVGGPPPASALDVTDRQWIDSFETIFLGAVRLARAAVPAMIDGGSIGFVLSSSVRAPIPNLSISNALRPALAYFAKDLADAVGPQGIRVIGLVPGRIETPRTKVLDSADPQAKARNEAAIPMRRLGSVSEFGKVAAFLLSPGASYISGSLVAVDGGMIRTI